MIRRELEIEDLPLTGAFIIKPKEFYDERGAFYKIYDRAILRTRGVEPVFAEDCLSASKKGVVRGMHYQLDPFSQAKLVRVIRGAVLDVIVDLRRSSQSFGKWFSMELTDQNRYSVYVPRGFAHGFLSLAGGETAPAPTPSVERPGGESGDGGLWGSVRGYVPGYGWLFGKGAGAGGVFGWAEALISAVLFFTDPLNWLRLFEVVAGFTLMLAGVGILVAGSLSKPDSQLGKAAGTAASIVPAARAGAALKGAMRA